MPWWLDINQIFNHFLNWVTTSILNSFDAIFDMIAKGLLLTPDVTGLPQVKALAGRSVWVVDTVFVLAFIAAGVITMTAGGDERARYTTKDLTPRGVVALLRCLPGPPGSAVVGPGGWAVEAGGPVAQAPRPGPAGRPVRVHQPVRRGGPAVDHGEDPQPGPPLRHPDRPQPQRRRR